MRKIEKLEHKYQKQMGKMRDEMNRYGANASRQNVVSSVITSGGQVSKSHTSGKRSTAM